MLAERLIALVTHVLALGVRLLLSGKVGCCVGRWRSIGVQDPLRHGQHRLHLKLELGVVVGGLGVGEFQVAPGRGEFFRAGTEAVGADGCGAGHFRGELLQEAVHADEGDGSGWGWIVGR